MTTNPPQHANAEPIDDKWPLTPLISVDDVPNRELPTVSIPRKHFHPLMDHAEERVRKGACSSIENSRTGVVGEAGFCLLTSSLNAVDTNIYSDGDNGVDHLLGGHRVQVKTCGRHRTDPALTVDKGESLRADYYVLASRVGKTRVRIDGYAPRKFVANASTWEYDGRSYHRVPREDLFPFPRYIQR